MDRAALLSVPPAERPARLRAFLSSLAARVLDVERRHLGPDRPLSALGLDSLGAAELGAAIEDGLGIRLPLTVLLEGPSLEELAAEILELLAPPPPAARVPPAPMATASPAPKAASAPPPPAADAALPANGCLNLSHGQRALWFLDRMAPGNPAHVIAGAARIRGDLDVPRLAQALRDLVARHPTLRTTFELRGETVVQVVHDDTLLPIEEEDATDLTGTRLAERLLEEAARPFDLAAGPLLRVALFRLAGGAGTERLIVLAVHHAVADFWSLGVLLEELGALWDRRVLPPLTSSYGDFVRRQEEMLAGPEGERLWSYWRSALPPRTPPLELPTDRPRPALATSRGGSRALRLGQELASRLRALGASVAATPFMTLLAAFLVLLHRYSGRETLLVGTPTAGRRAADLAGVVGYFVNPVVVVGEMAGAPTFVELLGRVRAAAIAAIAHQDFPFPLLVERLGVPRDPSHSPIFQSMFVLYRERRRRERGLGALALREAGPAIDLGGLVLEPAPLPRPSAQFDLSLLMAETDGGLTGSLHYASDLFDAATVARMASQLCTLLAGVAGGDGKAAGLRLHELPLLSPAERHQLELEWSSTGWQAAGAGDDLLHAPFERQAARTPAAIALTAAGAAPSLSYGELDARASRLAGALRAHGAGPERLVGICAEPSFAMIAGLLAILKAGGAYLPLDPSLPEERLAQILAGSGARLVLAEMGFAERFERLPALVLTLRPDAGVEAAAGGAAAPGRPEARARPEQPKPPACPEAQPDNPAYVLYTSGSTGTPKGVAVSHRAVVNRMRFQLADDLAPGARVLQRTRLGFDVSLVEVFAPLWAGATVVLAGASGRQQDAAHLALLVAEQQVTNINAPPALLPALLAEAPFRDCRALRRVVTGGERVPGELPRHFHAAFPGAAIAAGGAVPLLISRYGSTETTVSVSEWACRPGASQAGQSVPLGRPIAGARFHVLDRAWRETPPGVPGELCIAGVCLARGYLGLPDLTAAAFIPDPFAERAGEPGGRLYRTGDLVRHRDGGILEFLGRVDRQLKIRGFRLEPGEVEAALAGHPEVGEAAVVDRGEAATGGSRLVAYVVPRAAGPRSRDAGAGGGALGAGSLPRRLRQYLAARLPGYMVPSAVVALAALPLTPNGKLDRAALPPPGEERGEAAAPDLEANGPRGPAQELLAGIWGHLLGIERVESVDDFFELGGHSLLATQLVSRVRAVLGVELAVSEVFARPVLAELAARIEALLAAAATAASDRAPGASSGAAPAGVQAAPPSAIPRTARGGGLPLSFAQERLWFLDQLAPDNAVYHLPALLRLSGALRPAALAAAFAGVVHRHEALRTSFASDGGRAVQVVAAPAPAPFPIGLIDLAALPGPRREPESMRQARRLARRPFDLARGPLLRVQLLRLNAAEHLLLFVAHHVAADGWSIGVLARELTALYAAALAGRPSPLPELPVQYADFACWQRTWLAGGALDEQLGWWRRRLAEMPAALELPLDGPLPAAPDFRGATRRLPLPRALSDVLRAACRRHGATLFMAVLAAFQALLGRHAGQRRLVVGTPIANRHRAETEGLIGFFVNLLALPGDLAGDPSWRDLLASVREVCLGAYARQDLPFEKLVEELAPRRELAHSPVFQALLVLQNAPRQDLALPDLAISPVELDGREARFELILTVLPAGDDLTATLTYRTALFDGATAGRMLDHWQRLLASLATSPEGLVWEAPLLGEAETAQLLYEWNDTARRFAGVPARTGVPAGAGVPAAAGAQGEPAAALPCLHELFEAQARRTPGAAAVRCEGESLTYRQLDRRAARLALRLREAGVGPEIPVGLLVEPSVPAIVGLLGVLKAGGAYVPLDPRAPAERLAAMIADAGITVVLTGGGPAGAPGGLQAGVVRAIDLTAPEPQDAAPVAAGAPAMMDSGDPGPGPTRRAAAAENLAYVLYTSGSTGQPKGVAVPHGAVANYVLAIAEHLGLEPGSGFAMVQPLTVDSCVTAIFPPLVTGGCLHVMPRERALDAAALAAAFARQPIDCLKIAPSHLSALLSGSGEGGLLPRRWLIVGGEPSQLAWLCRLREAAPGCAVFNHYGPTEAAVGMLMYPVLGPLGASFSAAAPAGRPLANALAYLLDERRLPVPLGSRGTLHIGGDCLARGYLGRPAATAERFVPNPYAGRPGARLYDSGDVMRSTPRGELVFLGRLDHQVKVRGFRVELGEIEAAVARHPAVREAVVRTWEEAPGRAGLAAYLVMAEGGEAPTVAELRRFLAPRLPEHMAPSAVVALAAMPRTPHGKLDAKALPRPAPPAPPAAADAGEGGTAPGEAPINELLAGLWAGLLGRPPASAADNFFELGGHSLLATQLLSRIRAVFAIELPLRDIFEHPTLRELAERVVSARAARAGGDGVARPAPPPLVPRRRHGHPPLSFAQQRLWFLDHLEPGSALYNVPAAFALAGRLDAAALRRSLGEIVRRHEVLRTRFELVQGEPAQVILPWPAGADTARGLPRLPVADLAALPPRRRDEQAAALAEQAAAAPFHLSTGPTGPTDPTRPDSAAGSAADKGAAPLLRLVLLRLGEELHVLAATMHHIVSDAWSREIFARELAELYQAFAAGRPSSLPEPAIQYADFACWQRHWLSGEVLASEMAHWRQRLAGAPPVLALPLDRPRPEVRSHRGARRRWSPPAALAAAVGELARREGVTPFMALAAALQAVLARYAGQDDVSVGTPIAGRNRLETEGLIGFFVNTLVLRTDLAGDPSFQELLRRVREVALDAFLHQDLPFEKLVEELAPRRSLSHSPLFQVVFALQHVRRREAAFPGMRPTPLAVNSRTAKFDLTVALFDHGGELSGGVEYATDVFDGATIVRLCARLEALLAAAAADPRAHLSTLPLLGAGEIHQAVVEPGRLPGEGVAAAGDSVHEIFAARTARRPSGGGEDPDGGKDEAPPFIAPRSRAETALAAIWVAALGSGPVGIDDNFFTLGGDSILSLRVLTRAAEQGIAFSLQQLFRHQTIRKLLAEVGEAGDAGEAGAAASAGTGGKAAEPAAAAGHGAVDAAAAGGASGRFALLAAAARRQVPAGVEDAYPLTALQLGMLFHSRFSADSVAYHNVGSARVRMRVDERALAAAVTALVARHPVLRTSLHPTGFGEPLQLVHREVAVPLVVRDLRGLDPAVQEETLAHWFERAKRDRFDVSRAPLLRFEVHLLGAEELELGWLLHHAIMDGWSVAVMMADLFELYLARLAKAGRLRAAGAAAAVRPAPPALFRTFVALEREALAAEDCRRFWHEKAAEPVACALPSWPAAMGGEAAPMNGQAAPMDTAGRDAGPAAAAGSGSGVEKLTVPVTAEVGAALGALAAALGVPLRSALLAAHLKVCSWTCGQLDVMTGLVADGRPEVAGADRALGLFLNTLPFGLQLSPGTWADLVRRTFAAELEMMPYRRFPLARIAELRRGGGGTQPLFETAFTYVHFHTFERLDSIAGIEIAATRYFGATNFLLDVTFARDPDGSGLQLVLKFDRGRLEPAQVTRLARGYEAALAALSAPAARTAPAGLPEPPAPAALTTLTTLTTLIGSGRHDRCPCLSAPERHQLLVEWNEGATGDPAPHAPQLAHRLFAAQARRTPDAVALSRGSARLTYGELGRQVSRLAHRLRAAGVGPEVPVGILLPLGAYAVVAILATLAAGGVYVPLDQAWPRRRLQALIDDCGAAVVVTNQETGARGPLAEIGAPVEIVTLPEIIEIDAFDGDSRALPETEPVLLPGRQPAATETPPEDGALTPANLAYILYTSGSTGNPKGVMVSHAGLAAYLRWCAGAYLGREGSAGGAPLHSPLTFDLAVTSVFAPLLAGREVALVPAAEGIEGLARSLRDGGFGFVKLTPAHLDLLQHLLAPADVRAAAGALVVGGEQLYGAQLRLWRDHAPATRVVNEYGPTEAVVGCCVHELPAGFAGRIGNGPLPIGRPIPDARLYVLDGEGEPAPMLTPGELYIGGAGVARGYLGRPDLTAERFVPDALSGKAGARLYRSGDRCRHRPDGNLEFLGRTDSQVKLRGFRIELGEIEAALAASGAVRNAAVSVRDDGWLGRRLVAHVVPAPGTALDAGKLRQSLRERLPEHLVPAELVACVELPLTAAGKVDRRALDRSRPSPAARSREDAPPAPPRDPLEAQLVQVWEEVLGREQIGVADSFFDLGGHSLLAVRLMATLEERLGERLPISILFQAPTIERLAAVLRSGRDRRPTSTLVEIEAGGPAPPFFCVHPVGGNVLCYRELARCLAPGRPFYGLQAPEPDSGMKPFASLGEMAAHYLEAVRARRPRGPYLIGGWSMGAAVAFEMARQLAASEAAPELLVLIDPPDPPRPAGEIPDQGNGGARGGTLDEATLIAWFLEDVANLGIALPFRRADLRRLGQEEVLRLAAAAARQAGVPAAQADPARLAAQLERIKRHSELLLRYVPEPYPGPVTILKTRRRAAPALREAWRPLAGGGVEILDVAGNHYTMLRPPLVAGLARKLSRAFARAVPPSPAARPAPSLPAARFQA